MNDFASGGSGARKLADGLALAATPVFAIMALVTQVVGEGPMAELCGGVFSLGGMVPMYLLMAAFHSAPWLALISGQRRGDPRS